MQTKIAGIIPSRFASSRLPGKPLLSIGGKTMIQRVYEQACKCKLLNQVIVATDDDRIASAVKLFGGNVMVTSPSHLNGTERCSEVAAFIDADIIVNIQGDEPFIDPLQIGLLCETILQPKVEIATLVRPFKNADELNMPARVKAILSEKNIAFNFTRKVVKGNNVYKHIGLYAFEKEVLLKLVTLDPTESELAEQLEQLRWLDNGYKIHCAITESEAIAIDTPEDFDRVTEWFEQNKHRLA